MSNIAFTILRILPSLSALLLAVGTLLLGGCSSATKAAPASIDQITTSDASAGDSPAGASQASMGAVAQKPLELAELFIEGESANGDGRVRLRSVEVFLSGQQALDLLEIADAAHDQRDFATQYAAILAAMFVATPAQRQACWERYATMFRELPSTGAAALADLIREDITLAETHGNGITNDAAVAQQARKSRAASEYFTAEREYQQAQGYFDDDEALIMAARIRTHAAGVIDQGDSDWQFALSLDRLLMSTRSDLWESQASAADSTFAGGRSQWHSKLNWGRLRARNAIDLYRRGIEPPHRPSTLQ